MTEETNISKPEKPIEVGDRYTGKVTRIENFGVFVEILPGIDGLVFVDELDTKRVESVESVLRIGDELDVLVYSADGMARALLSHRAILEDLSPKEVWETRRAASRSTTNAIEKSPSRLSETLKNIMAAILLVIIIGGLVYCVIETEAYKPGAFESPDGRIRYPTFGH